MVILGGIVVGIFFLGGGGGEGVVLWLGLE